MALSDVKRLIVTTALATPLAWKANVTDVEALADEVDLKANDADLKPVAKSGLYSDLTGKPTLGTAAAQDATAFATAGQGATADTAVQSVAGKSGKTITLVKADVGLGSVDNTSDANKPVSAAQAAAILVEKNRAQAEEVKKLDKTGGHMTGPLVMDSNQIQAVASPSAPDHATNKGYVDNADYALAQTIEFTQTALQNEAIERSNADAAIVGGAPSDRNTLKKINDFATAGINGLNVALEDTQEALEGEAQDREAGDGSIAFISTVWNGVREPARNLFDPLAITQDTNINGAIGVTFPDVGSFLTGYMAVRQGAPVRVSAQAYNYAWYGRNQNFLSGVSSTNPSDPAIDAGGSIMPPSNAFYLRIAFDDLLFSRKLAVIQAPLPKIAKPFGWLGSRWHGLNIAIPGDSFEADGTPWGSYATMAAEYLQANLIRFPSDAVSGRTMGSLVPFLTASALASADLVHTKLGTNDHQFNTPLGTLNDAKNLTGTSTFYGSIAAIIKAVQDASVANAKYIRMTFATPPKKGIWKPEGYNLIAWDEPNGIGLTLEPYVQAIIEVCDYYAIPCLDLFRTSGFNKFTFGWLTAFDSLHPNAEFGVPELARQTAGFLACQ